MYRSISAVLLASALSLPSGALWAQGDAATMYQAVLGQWGSEMETPRGAVTQEFSFTLEENMLTGVVSGRQGETPLSNIEFADGKLTFEVERNFRGNSMVQVFTATIDGDEMTGTISGGRGGGRAFTAKRKAT